MTLKTAAPAPHPHGLFNLLRRHWFEVKLWKRILAALVLGVAVGAFWGEGASDIKWIGDLFIRLIRMLVVPLVFVLIVSGISALGEPKKLGSIGLKTIGLYVLMVSIAVASGLTIGTLVQPGLGMTLAGASSVPLVQPPSLGETFFNIIPLNPIKAIAEGEMLSVIFFGVLIGIGIIATGPTAKPVSDIFDAAAAIMLRLVQMVMEAAPFGVFALIASVVGAQGFSAFANLFWVGVCVLTGSAIQTFLVHGSLVRLGAWLPVRPFFTGVTDAGLVAFSTASSSATLPVAMSVAEKNLGVEPSVVATVLPLGATIGMDGSAMYIAILSMFAAQAFGIAIGPFDYLVLFVTIVTMAMGTAPIPSASLFMLAAVLGGVGVTPEQAALLVGFILPFDRPFDMVRSIPNVTSDLAVATAVARWEGAIDLDIYKASPAE